MKKALWLVLVPLVTLWSLAGRVHAYPVDQVSELTPGEGSWGYADPPVIRPGRPGSSSSLLPGGTRAMAQYAPSLYDALQQAPVTGGSSQRWGSGDDPTRYPPPDGAGGVQAKQYRFRGDKPPVAGDPEVPGDHRFRPLTAQERQRHEPASVWRPLSEAPQGVSPAPLPGHGQPLGPFGPPWGSSWGFPGQANPPEPVENSTRPDVDAENWFDRYYGRGRR